MRKSWTRQHVRRQGQRAWHGEQFKVVLTTCLLLNFQNERSQQIQPLAYGTAFIPATNESYSTTTICGTREQGPS